MKFSINDLSSKCDQIRRKLLIWSHLLKKSLMKIWKIDFCSNLGKNCRKMVYCPFFFFFFENLVVFPRNNAKWKFFEFLTFHKKFHVWQDSCFAVIIENGLDQLDYRILECLISLEK